VLLSVLGAVACAPPPCACPAHGGTHQLTPPSEEAPTPVPVAAPCSKPEEPALASAGHGEVVRSKSPVAKSEEELIARYEGKKALRVLKGKATYYGDSLAGNKTASGDRYDPRAFTAAHKTLPFNTVVRVVREDTQRYVYVRINDRGPFGNAQRIIDLSKIAADRLGMLRAGVVRVRVEVLD
jgi:rare lipoprotein A